MRAVRIEGADPRPLGAPPDWEEGNGHCSDLFVRREINDGVHYMRSAWEVEVTEAAMMLAGARFELGVAGDRHPVVQVGVGALPSDFEPVMHARQLTHRSGLRYVRVEMVYAHGGGRRAFAEEMIDGTLADAISTAVGKIENLARAEGWVQ